MTDVPPPPPLPGEAPPPPPPTGGPTGAAPYQDASALGRFTIVLLFVNVVMSFVLLGSTVAEIGLIERARSGAITFEEAKRNDDRQRALGGASSLAFLTAGILWLVWVHRAHTNLDALGARELRFSHGWAVGGFIVPLLNLVRAPQIMSELLRASVPTAGTTEWKARPTPPLVPLWWGTYLAGFVVRQVSSVAWRDGPLEDLLRADRFTLVAQVLIGIAGVLAAVMVRRVVTSQQARARAIAAGGGEEEGSA